MVGIALWSGLWVVLACGFFSYRSNAKFKKNMVLGVTLPFEAREDPEVRSILEEYRRRNGLVCGILGILSVGGDFLQDMLVSFVCWSVMLVLIMVVPMVPLVKANGRLKALKQERGWSGISGRRVRVDVQAMIDYPKPRLTVYLPPMALCLLMAVLQSEIWWLHGMFLGISVLSYCAAAFFYRKKSEMVDGDAELTRALSVMRYGMWKRIWESSAYCTAVLALSLGVMAISSAAGIALLIAISLLFGASVMCMELYTRRAQEKLTENSGKDWYVDEDDRWLGGIVYYAPDDSHVLVNSRIGTGSTFNLATIGGKLIFGAAVGLLVFAVVFLVSMGIEDRSDILLGRTEEMLYCENGSTRYEIPLEEIRELRLLEVMPEKLLRTNALGGQHLFKGSFRAEGMEDLKIIADPTAPPYILVETAEGQQYLFGCREPGDTEAVFAGLKA